MNDLNSVEDLRAFLATEMKRASNGESTPASANAVANLGGKIMGTVKMTLEYCKMTGQTPYIEFINLSNMKKNKQLEGKK
jgi:hypothetical protein